MFTEKEIQNITANLKKPDIAKVILFGSYSKGIQNQDSDLDLMVITKDRLIPDTFKQSSLIYKHINSYIAAYRKVYPIDLIVYTQGMFDKFIAMKSMFSLEILENGKIIYEADYSGMD
jgi:predicted nucleotidyltransferase